MSKKQKMWEEYFYRKQSGIGDPFAPLRSVGDGIVHEASEACAGRGNCLCPYEKNAHHEPVPSWCRLGPIDFNFTLLCHPTGDSDYACQHPGLAEDWGWGGEWFPHNIGNASCNICLGSSTFNLPPGCRESECICHCGKTQLLKTHGSVLITKEEIECCYAKLTTDKALKMVCDGYLIGGPDGAPAGYHLMDDPIAKYWREYWAARECECDRLQLKRDCTLLPGARDQLNECMRKNYRACVRHCKNVSEEYWHWDQEEPCYGPENTGKINNCKDAIPSCVFPKILPGNFNPYD